jgi:hypothetical protein
MTAWLIAQIGMTAFVVGMALWCVAVSIDGPASRGGVVERIAQCIGIVSIASSLSGTLMIAGVVIWSLWR